jgi:uncharacterized protein (DUF3820 family)
MATATRDFESQPSHPIESIFADCRFCGSKDLITVLCTPPSTNYARTGCRACGRHLGWEPAPVTIERCRSFVMPFGKHAGKALPDIPVSYLRWMMDEGAGKPNVLRIVAFWLEHGGQKP